MDDMMQPIDTMSSLKRDSQRDVDPRQIVTERVLEITAAPTVTGPKTNREQMS